MGKALKRAVKREAKRQELNKLIDAGGAVAVGARKAKKVLADQWYDRGESAGSFHKPWSKAEQDKSIFTASKLSAHIRSTI